MTTRIAADLAAALIADLTAAGKTVATAESCTGGLIAAALTDVPGASAAFGHGFVTYANDAKVASLAVQPTLIARHGAVSGPVARAMAAGARRAAHADLALAVTGIAGPSGGSAEKPVGLVWFGVATSAGVAVHRHLFPPVSRAVIRAKTVEMALRLGRAVL